MENFWPFFLNISFFFKDFFLSSLWGSKLLLGCWMLSLLKKFSVHHFGEFLLLFWSSVICSKPNGHSSCLRSPDAIMKFYLMIKWNKCIGRALLGDTPTSEIILSWTLMDKKSDTWRTGRNVPGNSKDKKGSSIWKRLVCFRIERPLQWLPGNTLYSFIGHDKKFGFNCTHRKLTRVLKAGEQQSSTL